MKNNKKIANVDKKNFCIRPFNSALIDTDGEMKVCCYIQSNKTDFKNYKTYNIKKNNLEDWWKNEYLDYLRENFLSNKKLVECSACWNIEKQGLKSFRQLSNFEYKTIFQRDFKKYLKLLKKDDLTFPEDIELRITNLCNLKCQMCESSQSSALLKENNDLNLDIKNQKDFNLDQNTFTKIEEIVQNDNLICINLRGGEPLFNKKIIYLLKILVIQQKSKKINLHISTNATICNNEIIKILEQFQSLRIMLSVEGTGSVNEYIRYPSKWKIVKNNILKFKELKNAYLYINTVVQNLNILHLDDLVNFAYENKIFIKFEKIAHPDYLDFTNLPKILLQKSYDKLSLLTSEKLLHTENLKTIIDLLKISIENFVYNEKKMLMFTDMIKKRDNYRNISIEHYIPEVYKNI